MHLKEYLDSYGIPKAKFAKKAGVCIATINNILKGSDIRISIASKIIKASHANITILDLINYIDNLETSKK